MGNQPAAGSSGARLALAGASAGQQFTADQPPPVAQFAPLPASVMGPGGRICSGGSGVASAPGLVLPSTPPWKDASCRLKRQIRENHPGQ